MWSASRPGYLRDLSGEAIVNTEDISMGARTINGEKFDVNTPLFTLDADAVQEWSIQGARNHPFHLHVYHFQALSDNGDFEAGEYYDTIAANGSVRFDLNAATSSPFEGITIMHCHILEHEDRGAMTWMDVVGGTPPPTFPGGRAYSEYYELTVDPTTNVFDGQPPQDEQGNSTPAFSLVPPLLPSSVSDRAVLGGTIGLFLFDNLSDQAVSNLKRSGDGFNVTDLTSLSDNVSSHAGVTGPLDPDGALRLDSNEVRDRAFALTAATAMTPKLTQFEPYWKDIDWVIFTGTGFESLLPA